MLVCAWMPANRILLLTVSLRLCELYPFPPHGFFGYKTTTHLIVGMWLTSECMIGWLLLNRSANVKEEICLLNLLTDRFAWRASATNHKKKNSETDPGQRVLIGLKGAKYCMVTLLSCNRWVPSRIPLSEQLTLKLSQLLSGHLYPWKANFCKTLFYGHLIPIPLRYVKHILSRLLKMLPLRFV